jgi:hypothetical protein
MGYARLSTSSQIAYALRTEDIDFAIETSRHCAADVPVILKKLGYLPVLDVRGLEKSSKEPFPSKSTKDQGVGGTFLSIHLLGNLNK